MGVKNLSEGMRPNDDLGSIAPPPLLPLQRSKVGRKRVHTALVLVDVQLHIPRTVCDCIREVYVSWSGLTEKPDDPRRGVDVYPCPTPLVEVIGIREFLRVVRP